MKKNKYDLLVFLITWTLIGAVSFSLAIWVIVKLIPLFYGGESD